LGFENFDMNLDEDFIEEIDIRSPWEHDNFDVDDELFYDDVI